MLYTRNKKRKRKPNWKHILWTAAVVVLLGGSIYFLCLALGQANWNQGATPPPATPSDLAPQGTPSASPSATPSATASLPPSQTPEPALTGTRSVSFGAVGDIMMHSMELQAGKTENGYDFSEFFARVTPYMNTQDFLLGNLETTIAKDKFDATSSPSQLLSALKDAGMDVLGLANEHILDRDIAGAQYTVEQVRAAGLVGVGAYDSSATFVKPQILTLNDLRIAILNYTERTEATPDGASDTVKYLTDLNVENDFKALYADEQGVDFIVVMVHWGDEDMKTVNEAQKSWAQRLADAGADVILGSHPHYRQPLARLTGRDGKRTLVAYSLGNFLSSQRSDGRDAGVILNFTLEKNFDTGDTSINQINYVPTWVLKYSTDGKYHFEIMQAKEYTEKRYQNMSKADRERIAKVAQEIKEDLGSVGELNDAVLERQPEE